VTLQGSQLTMAGLGLAAAGQIEAGIHLRWSMATGLGFPKYGFGLYRRAHLASTPSCVSLAIPPGGVSQFRSGDLTVASTLPMVSNPAWGSSGQPAIVVPETTQLTITCSRAMRELTVSEAHTSGTVSLAAYDRGTLVASAALAAPGGTATLAADRFTRVAITTASFTQTGFYSLCRVAVDSDAQLNWGAPLATLFLPPNWPTAALRIPATLHARYEPSFPRLLAAIKLLGSGPTYYTARGTTAPLPRFLVQPVELLVLAALDPAVARMLGLYYLDTSAAPGTAYDYRIVGHWTAPGAADHAWICFDLERGAPSAVATPTGLTVQARPVGGGLTEAESSADQVTAALAWSLPRDARGGLEPGAPVLYHVFRQVQQSSGWTRAVRLTANQPVLITADAATDALPSDFYVDGPLPAGNYRYQVQGVDLFGRASARSAAVEVTLADEVAPPPPVNVRGRPVQIDGRTDVTVSWEWPAERRAQAGDAAEFRVYYQTEDLRALTGTLTAVRDNGDGTSTVTTDLEPVADPARLIGGRLVNRGQVFPVTSIFATVGTPVISLRVANLVDEAGNSILPQAAQPIDGRAELAFLSDPGAALGRFALQVDWSDPARWQAADERVPLTAAEQYALTLTGLPLRSGPLPPVAYAFVGVATADLAGNLGTVSPPVTVAVAHTVAPARPPGPSGPTYATRADYHGRSRYTLTLEDTEAGLYYEVYRALDAAILAKAPPDSADDDASLLTLADQHEEAFTRLDTRDAAGQPLVGTGGVLTWADDLPGIGRNRFVYKVQTVDLAGNRSALSPGLRVHLIDVVPPRAPVVGRVTGGGRAAIGRSSSSGRRIASRTWRSTGWTERTMPRRWPTCAA
jgi:hypothetical protein